jgi:hypothetical protein
MSHLESKVEKLKKLNENDRNAKLQAFRVILDEKKLQEVD